MRHPTTPRAALAAALLLAAALPAPAQAGRARQAARGGDEARVLHAESFERPNLERRREGFSWRASNANRGSRVEVSTDIARTGRRSLRFQYGAVEPCRDSWAEQRFDLGENLREVWLEWYVYLPRGTEGLGPRFTHRQPMRKGAGGACSAVPDRSTNNKFFALWDVDYTRKHVKVLAEYRRSEAGAPGDSRLYGMWCSDTRNCGPYNWPGGRWEPAITDALRGRWVQVRVYARVADSKAAANGVLRLWVDGVRRIDMQRLDLAPKPGGNLFFRNGYLMGWANSGFDQPTSVYVDDFRAYAADPGWR